MGCPIGPLIEDQMRAFLAPLDGIGEVRPEMVLRPAWSPEMMSEEAKAALGMFHLAGGDEVERRGGRGDQQLLDRWGLRGRGGACRHHDDGPDPEETSSAHPHLILVGRILPLPP